MSAQSTAEWINTKEYQDLNFARKDLVINPAKACQPLGALVCALGVEGCLPFVHGSQGCAAYFRNNLSRHYREPISAVSDSMTEDSAVFGGQKNLIDGMENAYTLYKPKMMAIFTSCMAEVIGDDINAYVDKARLDGVIPEDFPIALAHTPSFKGSHITGYDNMLKGFLQELAKPRNEQELNDRLYVVSGFDPSPANLREIKRLLGKMGVEYTLLPDYSDVVDSPNTGTFEMYPGGTPMNEVVDALNAESFLFLQSYSTTATRKYLNKENVPIEMVSMPIGISNTDRFLMKVSEMTGKPIPQEIDEERGRVVDAATDAHPYIHGKRFALFGDPDALLGTVSFLLEMGGVPVHIVSTNGTPAFQTEMEELLDSSPYGKSATVYVGKDLWHLRSLLINDPVDMLIGDSHGKYAARDAGIPLVRVGFPITDRVNLHRYPTVGYEGTLNLITMIANTFLDEKDRNSDNAHFELLR
ncbi:nitrogenase molybdenum-iron protein subunit beta [Desulfitobacterium sp. AusDCA]|uniref:nitrogenase molybdenum-iron protein subunit beta n=1 Tax=Desulfitobacterium sp. AusDCA TaxID=3240383 RepID=UPI003DA6D8E5